MPIVSRLAALFVLSTTVIFGQDPPRGLRLTAPERAVQMRVEVLYAGGTALYDSDWKSGNILDFSSADLPYGSYRLRILSRDLDGKVTERQTTLTVAPDRTTIDPPFPRI